NQDFLLKAQALVSQAAAAVWFPKLRDFYLMIKALAKAEQEQYDREKGRYFAFEKLVLEGGLEARGFRDSPIENYALAGDTFQLVPHGDSEPLSLNFTVLEAGFSSKLKQNYIRFESPKLNGDETLSKLLLAQIGNGGMLKRIYSRVAQRQAEMMEGMLQG